MSENNKTYRINTTVGDNRTIHVNINQDYESFNILSLNISKDGVYKMHTSNYGCIAGRVLANDAFGIPNAKVSVFIPVSDDADVVIQQLYSYRTVNDKDSNEIRYNTLPDSKQFSCHEPVGTFPSKRAILDNDVLLEVYEKYYKYSTVTNGSGDYMIFGVPTGNQIVHVDIDLSDIGILSQKPRDLMYQGYNKEQFDSPVKFKSSTNLDYLPQIISQTFSVDVSPFWGEESETNKIGITRNDMNVAYKFIPTCVFMGSLIYDTQDNAITKKCVPQVKTGLMNELQTGPGRIEMIRKKDNGEVESFPIEGEQLVDGSGTWCYQIPMNLDYMGTDEFGNMVPTNDVNRGVPTRTRVRFRFSLNENDTDMSRSHLVKVLVPNNPIGSEMNEVDYNFGSLTEDDEYGGKSFRDLFYNNVYTVKMFIPRLQRGHSLNSEKFTGFKLITEGGTNNPLPYNNMRVKITFMFVLQCMILKTIIRMVSVYNRVILPLRRLFKCTASNKEQDKRGDYDDTMQCMHVDGDVCPQLENYYFAPGCKGSFLSNLAKTLYEEGNGESEGNSEDDSSYDATNKDNEFGDNNKTILTNTKRLIQCIEITLAMEYNVIKFDFYNDWINGLLYFPRWYANTKKKKSFFFGLIKIPAKLNGCVDNSSNTTKALNYVQQCSLKYNVNNTTISNVTANGCKSGNKQKCHKTDGLSYDNSGKLKFVQTAKTIDDKYVYYLKSLRTYNNKKIQMFATDIVLLGSLDDYNKYSGVNIFDNLSNSTFQLPPNIASTTLDDDTVKYEMSTQFHVIGNTYIEGSAYYIGKQQQREKENKDKKDYTSLINEYANNAISVSSVNTSEQVEISGIDWGYYPNISGIEQPTFDETKFYLPGGHFIGISCVNAAVNIQSCVNLSRICELGSSLSERIEHYIYKQDGSVQKDKVLESTGLISDSSTVDANSRSIFASLNSNHLRTIIDRKTGFRMYDFIPLYPNGYDGILNNKITKTHKLNGDVENKKDDYIRFRYGLMVKNGDETSKTWIERNNLNTKFLLYNNKNYYYQMPIYDNSFYFYFGLSRTMTAYDRFLRDYYATCPEEIESIRGGEDNISTKGNITYIFEGLGINYFSEYVTNVVGLDISEKSDETQTILVGNIEVNELNVSFKVNTNYYTLSTHPSIGIFNENTGVWTSTYTTGSTTPYTFKLGGNGDANLRISNGRLKYQVYSGDSADNLKVIYTYTGCKNEIKDFNLPVGSYYKIIAEDSVVRKFTGFSNGTGTGIVSKDGESITILGDDIVIKSIKFITEDLEALRCFNRTATVIDRFNEMNNVYPIEIVDEDKNSDIRGIYVATNMLLDENGEPLWKRNDTDGLIVDYKDKNGAWKHAKLGYTRVIDECYYGSGNEDITNYTGYISGNDKLCVNEILLYDEYTNYNIVSENMEFKIYWSSYFDNNNRCIDKNGSVINNSSSGSNNSSSSGSNNNNLSNIDTSGWDDNDWWHYEHGYTRDELGEWTK